MRVLLIRQDVATAANIKTMLIRENFICDTTDLGKDGLDISKLRGYDVILFDLSVPNINGYEVLRRLRRECARTPVLILSGLTGLDDKIKDLGFGDDDHLTNLCDHRDRAH